VRVTSFPHTWQLSLPREYYLWPRGKARALGTSMQEKTPEPVAIGWAEQLIHTTVRIECVGAKKDEQSFGTGFFFDFLKTAQNKVPAIVTNRHVLEGASKAYFHLTLEDGKGYPDYGKHQRFVVENFQGKWIGHPDKNVDLAIFGVADLLKKMVADKKPW
jgi:hypothetical protein